MQFLFTNTNIKCVCEQGTTQIVNSRHSDVEWTLRSKVKPRSMELQFILQYLETWKIPNLFFRILQKLGIVQMLMFPFGQFFMQENTQEVDRGTTYAKQSQCCPQSAGLFLLTNDLYLFLNG